MKKLRKLRALTRSFLEDPERRARSGRLLGLLLAAVGFAVIGKAWDGAASINFVQGQIPYLLSGGFMGLALVVTGCTLIFLSTLRTERRALHDKFDEMSTLLARTLNRMQVTSGGAGTSAEEVVAAASVYHRATCRILNGKDGVTTITVEQAAGEGLTPCRACEPPRLADVQPRAD